MKLFTRKNALLLTAVIILLAAACAFALSREQKTPFVSEPAPGPRGGRGFMSGRGGAAGGLRAGEGRSWLTGAHRTGAGL